VLNLTLLARWAMERAFPGALVEIRRVELMPPDRLVVDTVTLRSRKDGAVLLSLDRGGVTFTFEDLFARRIGEVRLEQPVLHASPRLLEIFSPSPSPSPQGRPWEVRRLVCDYGQLTVSGYGGPGLQARAKFAFDLRNFAPATAPETRHELILWDIQAGRDGNPVLSLDLVRVGFDFASLSERTLSSLQISGGSLSVGATLREILSAPASPPAAPAVTAAPSDPWKIGDLNIEKLRVRVDDSPTGLTDIRFAVNLRLRNVPLSQAIAEMGAESQSIEISHLIIRSPLDPLTRVITIDSLFIRFTLAGLLRREVGEITILNPAVHVGEDLFWYMETAGKNLSAGQGETSEPGWTVRTLRVEYGRLILGSGGRREYGLPLNFRTVAENVSLDNLAALKLRATLEIPPQKYAFSSYQLEFASERGDLRFSYPPETGADNLVGVIRLKDIRWRQFRAASSWVSVTFDRQGINGTFGGSAYRGEAWGGFSFAFANDVPWTGWLSGKRFDLKNLTDVLTPKTVRMTGALDFAMEVNATGRSIEKVSGSFQLKRPGQLRIDKLNDLMARIPDSWTQLKQSGTKLILEALRDYDYTRGTGDFQFANSEGSLRIKLQGPSGSRNLDISLHSDEPGPWKLPATNP
jgi:hypothetical protein